jgi:hypothetical protein
MAFERRKPELGGVNAMKKFFFIVTAAFVFSSAHAAENGIPEASLFFTPQEAHDAEALAQRLAPAGQGDIHLGAVLYYGPHDWTLWLQGEKWTPETSRDNVQILDVTENNVRLLWRGEDGSDKAEITLKPNQSYQISTGKIISAR